MKRKFLGCAAVIGCALTFAALGTACDGSDLTKAFDTIDSAIKGHQHDLVFMAARESTCTERGCIDHWYCSAYNCYKLFSDEKGENELTSGVYFPVIPHAMEFHERIEATCTSFGTQEYYQCTSCGGMFNDEQGTKALNENLVEIWPKAHTIIYKQDQKPTCTEEGEKAHYFCTVCEGKFSDERGYHAATDLAIPPAHDEAIHWSNDDFQHWHEYYCEHKDLVQKENHTFENEVCSVCYFHKPSEGLFYEINDDGETAKLTGKGTCTGTAVYVASAYEGKPVTEIEADVFKGCTDIKTVSLPDSLERIGTNAFRGCTRLSQIKLPFATTEIGEYAFASCVSLTKVHVSGPSIKIGAHAFDACVDLKSFNGFSGAKEIGDYAFYRCTALESLKITTTGATIGNSAFASCANLKDINLKSVKAIGDQAFYKCSSLESVVVGDRIVASAVGSYAIGAEAFSGCNVLESVTLGRGVETIGDNAFNGCAKLATFTIGKNSSMKTIGDRAFYECVALTKFILPKGLESIGESAFEGCTTLTRVDIPISVTTIKSNAFANTRVKIYTEATRTPDGWATDWRQGNSVYMGQYVDQES